MTGADANGDTRFSLRDAGVVAGLVVFGWVQYLEWPYAVAAGDFATYASIAAGWLSPERFAGDPLIGDPASSGPYIVMLLTPLLMAVQAAFENPIFPMFALIVPAIVIQGMGFYLLGRRLFGNRLHALLLVAATFIPVPYTDWILPPDLLPRVMLQACMPYLWLLFLRRGADAGNWIWMMAVVGLTFYVNPASAPTLGFAFFAALLAFYPPGRPAPRRLVRHLLAGFAFAATAIPFAAAFFAFAGGREAATLAEFRAATDPLGFTYHGVGAWIGTAYGTWIALALVVAGLAGLAATWLYDPARRGMAAFFTAWMAGLWFVAAPLVWIENQAALAFDYVAILTQAVGATRYTAPVMMIFVLNGLLIAGRRFGGGLKPALAAVPGAVFLLFFAHAVKFYDHKPWFNHWYQFVPFLRTVHCWVHGDPMCARHDVALIHAPVAYLRDAVPAGTKVLPMLALERVPDGQDAVAAAIRYMARLPVVYGSNDYGPIVLYGTRRGGYGWLRWREIHSRVTAVRQMPDTPEKTRAAVTLARELGARLLLVDFPVAGPALGAGSAVIFENARYRLIRIGSGG